VYLGFDELPRWNEDRESKGSVGCLSAVAILLHPSVDDHHPVTIKTINQRKDEDEEA